MIIFQFPLLGIFPCTKKEHKGREERTLGVSILFSRGLLAVGEAKRKKVANGFLRARRKNDEIGI
jgi:hypothetical protein